MRFRQPDYFFAILVWSLVLAGLAALLSASLILGKNNFNDPFYYVKHQFLNGVLLGALGFFLTSSVYYRRWEKVSFWFFLFALVLMILVFTPLGLEIKGARRWLQFPGLPSFQPSEIFKIAAVMYLSAWAASRGDKINSFKDGVLPFLLFVGAVGLPLIFQHSTSTLIITMLVLGAVYFLSGAKISRIFVLGAVAAALVVVLVFVGGYQIKRIQSFLGGSNDAQGQDYHIRQSLIAIGSGGWFGVGFGNAVSKNKYLPEPMGDSIFAVIAQELGFFGSFIIVGAYILLLGRGFYISRKSPDKFSKLLSAGLSLLVASQAFVNIGAMSKLMPLTGQPLPFLSYGGTNLAVLLTSMGLIVNISKYTRK